MKRMIGSALVLLLVAGAAWGDDAAELQKLRAENAQLKARVAELEKQLGIAQQQKQQLAAEKQAMVTEREQAAAEQRDFYIASEYNQQSGRTEVTSRVTTMVNEDRGQLRRHWMSLAAEYAGQPGSAKPNQIDLVIQTYATGRKYRSVDDVRFTIGTQSFEAPVANYDSKMRLSGSPKNRTRNDDEYITIRLTLEQFKAVANAYGSTNVTGQLGHQGFTLTRDQINMCRAMLDELGLK
ncbi:hypothetical protein HED60_08015 [Planctomycetales bacterium ZRK34]|nr:hypothetical protein HED60_08015 [Planctomycetales bacterium ZRK34]